MQPTKALVTLRYVTRIAAVIILIAVAVGFFLPADYRIERSIRVSSDQIERVEERLYSAQDWTNWMHIEGGALRLTAQSSQALTDASAFTIDYDGKTDKQGTLEIVAISPSVIEFIVTPNQKTSPVPNRIEIIHHQADSEWEVQWLIEGELDVGFLSPYLALMADRIAGSNIERSLANLNSTF